jgi:hypothetical protein
MNNIKKWNISHEISRGKNDKNVFNPWSNKMEIILSKKIPNCVSLKGNFFVSKILTGWLKLSR